MKAYRLLLIALAAGCPGVPAIARAQVQQIDVWIDPGHGGGDPGNLPADNNPAHNESQITIQQSAALLNSLLNLAYNVALTRNSDTLLPSRDVGKCRTAQQRTMLASRQPARYSSVFT